MIISFGKTILHVICILRLEDIFQYLRHLLRITMHLLYLISCILTTVFCIHRYIAFLILYPISCILYVPKALLQQVLLCLYQSRYNPCSNSIFYNFTFVCINPDTTPFVFSVCINRDTYILCICQHLSIKIHPLYSSVSINPDTSSVFVNIYQSRYILCIHQYLSGP